MECLRIRSDMICFDTFLDALKDDTAINVPNNSIGNYIHHSTSIFIKYNQHPVTCPTELSYFSTHLVGYQNKNSAGLLIILS